MLRQVRELEKELKLAPINIDLFGDDMISRAKAIRYYLLSLMEIKQEQNK